MPFSSLTFAVVDAKLYFCGRICYKPVYRESQYKTRDQIELGREIGHKIPLL